ncbi:nuclear pore complex protein GP210 isoform X1 [Punica granatum]|uniref:Nuclear pore complex protein GP210 isoform X1 n=1 Tax=Punica granatum TaxID=22663 RepID=A0A6P8E9K7_PUNGR|nr:nuclear pore complex protein GP210 isoform X1 [Punica granatum]
MSRLVAGLLLLLLQLLRAGEAVSDLGTGPHITDVNILLPPKMTRAVEYRLQGSDGCFKWTWDHHDVLSVIPEYNISNHCSTSARLRSIAPYSGRKESAVYATDLNTGTVIRCKVFIDNFSRIQIFHSSIKLDLDGLATLRVHAFDSEENVFSSLVGLQFMWQLAPQTTGQPHHLVHVPLKVSPLSDCGGLCGDLDVQIKIEDSGTYSDLFVVKGAAIGHEVISVHLMEPELKHLTDKIVLTVAEAISVEPPSPVFVLIGAVVHYSLKVIRQNTPQAVPLPSPHYRWSVFNSSVAHVDPTLGVTHALSLGTTTITVEDTRVAGHKQGSSLHVVLPDSICLYLSPLSSSGEPIEGTELVASVARWYVVAGHQYVIQIKVFSQGPDVQEIYITENEDVVLYDNQSDNWEVLLVPNDVVVKHGWQNSRILRATSPGVGKLIASLTYFSGNDRAKEVLKVVQEVMVCDQVKIVLEKRDGYSHGIVLPWAPGIHQEVQLKATGGCAKASIDFKWFSSDMDVLSVSTSGVIQAKKPGKATIKVVSIFDPFNYDEVNVEVSTPTSMVMLQNFPVETIVGSHLEAAVTLKALNGDSFYRCDAFNSYIKWKAGSEFFTISNATGEAPKFDKLVNTDVLSLVSGPPCSWTSIYAAGPGQTMLHATLSKDYSDHLQYGPIVLKASSHIAAYAPLLVSQVGDGNQFGGYWYDLAKQEAEAQLENLDKLYLAPATHLDVMLLGGPEKWGRGVDFIDTVQSFDQEHASVEDEVIVQLLSSKYGSLYRISCQKLGNFELIFKRGNLIGDDHPLPAIVEKSLWLVCSFPASIVLVADEPVNERNIIQSAIQGERGPGRIRATPVTVANGRTIRIAAVGITDSGEALANSSSLHLKWELSSCNRLAFWDINHERQRSQSDWERFLVLQNETGLCTVRATVIGLDKTTGFHVSTALPESSLYALTDALRLQLVSTLRVYPDYIMLYSNPDAKVNLSISGGSCFLEAAANDSQVVEIIQPPPGLQCLQLFLSPRGLGTALVTVNDIGLAPHLTASALVRVADVDWIKITSGDEISLMEGTSKSIDLVAGTNDGSTFDHSQYTFMNIHVHIEDPIVKLVPEDDSSSSDNGHVKGPSFVIAAKQLGITNLHVSFRQKSGNELLTQQIKIEVYAPPIIHPRDIFLAPGASYVLTVSGGPTVGVHREYASSDNGIATVDKSSGRLSAISPGNASIVATVYGSRNTVVCQAHGRVIVGVPSSAILNAQSDQLAVGREMPIYPFFPEGSLFSLYGLCKSYKWTLEDDKVLGLQLAEHVDEMHGTQTYVDEKELGLINILHGRSAGRTSVAVTFSCDFVSASYSESKFYSSSLSILVVPDPPLALGVPITWILPPYYITSGLLPSSAESHGKEIQKGNIMYSLLRSCGEKSTMMLNDAMSLKDDRIITGGSNDLDCIQAKDRTTGRTEIASCVRVTEVAQIRISNTGFSFPVVYLALGAELELPITFYDVLGNPFHEAYNAIAFDADINYPDVVSVNSTTSGKGHILLKAVHHGRALLRVSVSDSPRKADYVLLSVGAHIYPQNPVIHTGSSVNFSLEGFDETVSGRWISANESVMSVNMNSGKSEAVGEGMTQVIFECPSMKLQTTVSVLRGNIVFVDAPEETVTNVPFPRGGYAFSVRFRSPYVNVVEVLGKSKGIPYDCSVDPPFIGYAKPWVDPNSGNSYCLFFPYSPEHLVHSLPKSKGMRSDISITINAILREANNASGSASALFIGGFSIIGMSKDGLHLNLTPDSNKTTMTILGNTDVEIHWQAREMMKISPTRREDSGIGGFAEYEVKVLRPKNFKDQIIISLPATGQRSEIDVSYESGEKKTTFVREIISIWSGILVSLAILIVTVAIFLCILSQPNRSPPSISQSTPQGLAPATPSRSPGGVSTTSDQSPRTPQPFVDYVRRTVDETPYYRRDGARRRFNPQNTY